jgi:hypothetical protein
MSHIKLEIHWYGKEVVLPAMWEIDGQTFTVVKAGFDTYAGIPVYIVKEINTVRLIARSLVIGEDHFKGEVECLS